AAACETKGIAYVHVPELGIATERRRGLETQSDYDALFAEYERDDLPRQAATIERIAAAVRSGQRVALTCFEARPEQCHRHCVAAAVERALGGRVTSRSL